MCRGDILIAKIKSLRGGVEIPTGGKVREGSGSAFDSVRFRNRRYSPDDRGRIFPIFGSVLISEI